MTTRRKILAGIGAALAPGPLAAQTQPQSRMRRLSVLMGSLASDGEGQMVGVPVRFKEISDAHQPSGDQPGLLS